VTGLAALVAVANARGNALMTETGTEIGTGTGTGTGTEKGKGIGTETTGMIETGGEGVVLQPSRGDVLPLLTGGQQKNALTTARGPHHLLMI
jgi:hypothetical protein